MEHSTAIMEDARDTIAATVHHTSAADEESSNSRTKSANEGSEKSNPNWRKRKADSSLRHGSQRGGRGGRGGSGGRNDRAGNKKRDMGRAEYFRDSPDKRQKTEASREKRLEGNGPNYGMEFSKEEIDAEERRPKRKVAVMIGYSGTGYKGMQISASEKTIEGDLFKAFVAAGAISKANADDPKKASLVRCARTDKGVHAAGNVVSLKLIVEDEEIVARINEHLSPQIRVWGIERTIGSFNCYQACDSRWYEYLIPSHAFLPPHPSSWLAKKLEELADEAGDRAGYEARQAEVEGFWQRIDREQIEPVITEIDEDIRSEVIKALRGEEEDSAKTLEDFEDGEQLIKVGRPANVGEINKESLDSEKTEDAAIIITPTIKTDEDLSGPSVKQQDDGDAVAESNPDENGADMIDSGVLLPPSVKHDDSAQISAEEADRQLRLRAATKKLRQTYAAAKRHYRIPKQRVDRVQAALNKFLGTKNYHNYTVQMTFRDPSAKRHIKSFVANPQPLLIGEGPDETKSEWLSLKVHGQSFMMHQIRKMIGMITLLVRCGANLSTMDETFTDSRFSIPKVPGLGLLLERPVFDSYNDRQATQHDREKIDFGKYETKLEEFKQREIYQRIFREEEERNEFGKWFNHVDNFKEPNFLFVTSKGVEATKKNKV